MAAEVQVLVLGFDYVFLVKDFVKEILGKALESEAFKDSRSVFNAIANNGKAIERHLPIDVSAVRQSYDAGAMARVAWIPGKDNPADSLAKPVLSTSFPLCQLMTTSAYNQTPQGWTASSEMKIGGVLHNLTNSHDAADTARK